MDEPEIHSTTTGRDDALDAEVWKNLPDYFELFQLVLSRLPWWSNLRLRAVSKSWKSILSDPALSTNCLPLPCARQPICILSTSEDRHALVNYAILEYNRLNHYSLPNFTTCPEGYTISAATGRLFLIEGRFDNRIHGSHQLMRWLVNPLNMTWKNLPPVPRLETYSDRSYTFLHHPLTMVVDEKTPSVKVVAMEFIRERGAATSRPHTVLWPEDTELWRIYVWDSADEAWQLVCRDGMRSRRLSTVENAVIASGDLYIHARQRWYGGPRHRIFKCFPNHLVELNTEFSQGPLGVPFFHMFQHRGFLMFVVGTWKHAPRRFVELWKCDHFSDGANFENVATMPQQLVVFQLGRGLALLR